MINYKTNMNFFNQKLNYTLMRISLFLLFIVAYANLTSAQNKRLNIVVIGAHHDNCDIGAGGTEKEHEHETLKFLAVSFLQSYFHFQWVSGFVCFLKCAKTALSSLSVCCEVCKNKN